MFFEGVQRTHLSGTVASPIHRKTTWRRAFVVADGGGHGRSQGRSCILSSIRPFRYVSPATSASACTISMSWDRKGRGGRHATAPLLARLAAPAVNPRPASQRSKRRRGVRLQHAKFDFAVAKERTDGGGQDHRVRRAFDDECDAQGLRHPGRPQGAPSPTTETRSIPPSPFQAILRRLLCAARLSCPCLFARP